MKCPDCGKQSNGAFCPECGAALASARCKACNGQLVPGARFCNHCGVPVTAQARSNLPWFIAGGALVALLIVLLIPALRTGSEPEAGPPPGAAPFAGTGDGGGTPPPLTGTPREQADRLFNRIMQLRESGDTARASFFLPMGIQAYANAAEAGQMDDDGLYHLSLLQTSAGDAPGARGSAEQILAKSPTHLLALSAAGQAAEAQGDSAAARTYYKRFLDAYEAERKKTLPEYTDHARVLPEYEAAARAFIAR
jgi:hypothetical protein